MLIKFQCPSCQHRLRAESAHAGRRATCSRCKKPLTVPDTSTLPADDHAAHDDADQIEPTPEQPPPALPAPSFISFPCPGCGKRIGFPGQGAGAPANCPACRALVMVPEKAGGESFIIGGAPTAPSPAPLPYGEGERKLEIRNPKFEGKGKHENGKVNTPPSPLLKVTPREAHAPVNHAPHRNCIAEHAHAVAHTPPAKRRMSLKAALLSALALLAVVAVAGPWVQRMLTRAKTLPAPAPKADAGRATLRAAETLKRDAAPASAPGIQVAPSTGEKVAAPAESGGAVTDAMAVDPVESFEIRRSAAGERAVATADLLDTLTQRDTKHTRGEDEDEAAAPAPEKKAGAEEKPAAKPGKTLIEHLTQPEPAPEPKPEAAPAAPVAPAAAPAAAAARPVLAPLPCEKCMGTKTIPLAAFTPFVWLQSEQPNPSAAIPWRPCPQCQAGPDAAALVQAEIEQMKGALAAHRKWEGERGRKYTFAQTRHVTVRAELSEAALRRVATTMENLASHLEQTTQTTVLTQTRPGTHELLVFNEPPTRVYFLMPGAFRNDINERFRQAFVANQIPQRPAENAAVFKLGRMMMAEATEGKAPAWLTEGFAAYCENAVLKKNLVCALHQPNEAVRYGENWDSAIKRLALQKKLPAWEHLFAANRAEMSATEYAADYSIVAFLMRTTPRNFARFVVEQRNGTGSAAALEMVYGKPVKEIQAAWAQWAAR
jgi:hypothetical protein